MSGANRHAPLAILHFQGGGCGGCGLEIEALLAGGRSGTHGLRLVESPRHADLLLVSGSVGHTLMQALEAAWSAMPEPKWLVAAGACAVNGGPFGRDGYAVTVGIGTRLPVSLVIPGSPPAPEAVLAGLRLLADSIRGPFAAAAPELSPPSAPARPPAAPRHPHAGDDSSAG